MIIPAFSIRSSLPQKSAMAARARAGRDGRFRPEQGFARREVTIERSYADARALRHGFEAGVGATGAEDSGRRLEQAFTIADRVDARLARGICCTT
jgi:hypothetical protein